jgi:glycosyltransferase involved in cell wall biosynthesis
LCMIVKNEAEYLAKCLKSAKPFVDEMILVDTGSSDKHQGDCENIWRQGLRF